MADTSTTWPPPSGVSTSKVPLSSSILAITASTRINAPAEFVFEVLRNTDTYKDWCSFVPKVAGIQQPSSTSTTANDAKDTTSHDAGDQIATPAQEESDAVLRLGTKFIFLVIMGAPGSTKETPTHLIVTDVSTPSQPSSYIPLDTLREDPTFSSDLSTVYRIAWSGDDVGFFAKGLRTERFHEVIVRGDEECEVRTWESMGGVLARTVKWLYKKTLEQKFEGWCADLKRYGEEKWLEARR